MNRKNGTEASEVSFITAKNCNVIRWIATGPSATQPTPSAIAISVKAIGKPMKIAPNRITSERIPSHSLDTWRLLPVGLGRHRVSPWYPFAGTRGLDRAQQLGSALDQQ